MGKLKDPNTGWKGTLIGIAVIAGLAYGGWKAYKHFFVGEQKAVVADIGMFGDGIQIILVFKELPSGDPLDVELELTSEALNEDLVLDWEQIGDAAFRQELSPDEQPPINEEVWLRISLKRYLRWGEEIDRSDAFIDAKLSWGGVQQDTARTNIFALLR